MDSKFIEDLKHDQEVMLEIIQPVVLDILNKEERLQNKFQARRILKWFEKVKTPIEDILHNLQTKMKHPY